MIARSRQLVPVTEADLGKEPSEQHPYAERPLVPARPGWNATPPAVTPSRHHPTDTLPNRAERQ